MRNTTKRDHRRTWRITDLPSLTEYRDWRSKNEILSLIQYAYPGMEKRSEAEAMLKIGLLNGIIEEVQDANRKVYRIRSFND